MPVKRDKDAMSPILRIKKFIIRHTVHIGLRILESYDGTEVRVFQDEQQSQNEMYSGSGVEESQQPGRVTAKFSGICGSDVPRVLNHGVHFYPIVLGHEFSAM